MVNWNNNPILAQRRKGTLQDPFVEIEEALPVIENKVILTEIPNRTEKIDINYSKEYSPTISYEVGDLVSYRVNNETYECISSCTGIDPTNDTYWERIIFIEVPNMAEVLEKFEYYVDYLNGIVFHNPCFNNDTLLYKYKGEGTHLFPADRIYSKSKGSQITKTLEEIVNTSAKSIVICNRPPTDEEGNDNDVWLVYKEEP